MKIKLTFVVDVSDAEWKSFLEKYSDVKDETQAETLAREAIAHWDSEGLLATGDEPVWEWSQP